ncbi:MAG: type II secretion system protein, partial [Patescibacteria group bacterium]
MPSFKIIRETVRNLAGTSLDDRRKPNRKLSPAFTLAELIVVITILAILATVGFLALSGYSQDAKDASVKANVRSVMTAISSESAVTNNSPRYYVAHDPVAALTGAAVAYVDGYPLALTGGDWNQSGTNYSAGNPDWTKLKLNPDKFKLSSVSGWFSEVLAAYDPKAVSVGAVDAALASSANGKKRAASFFQVTGTAPVTGAVSV